jgi:hypothetical protein
MDLNLTPTAAAPDDGNALYLAVASLLAYGNDARPFRQQLRLEGGFALEGPLQAFVGRSATDVVVVFRGSRSPLTAGGRKDWLLTAAHRLLAPPADGPLGADFAAVGTAPRFHQGLVEALAGLWDDLLPLVRGAWDGSARPLWLTGHSLGGALAALAAWPLERRGLEVHQVYTFGAPMFCDTAAVEGYNLRLGSRVWRYVNEADLIPALPLSGLLHNDYRHVGTPVVLPADEAAPVPPARGVLAGLRAAAALLGVPLAVDDLLWEEFIRRKAAHSLSKGYISRLRDRLQKGP